MNSVRLASPKLVFMQIPCSRCHENHQLWDRISNKPYCPGCLESLSMGEGAPIIEKTESRFCAVCGFRGTVRFLTFPLQKARPLELDLCGNHLRALIGRYLEPFAFERIRRQLQSLKLEVNDIFFLHHAFYDPKGRALRPAGDWI